jgi:hypothetical protein
MIARSILEKTITRRSFDEYLTFLAEVLKDCLIRLICRVQQHPPWLAFMRAPYIGMRARISINCSDIKIRLYEAVTIHVKMIINCLPLRQPILARYTAYETPIQSGLDVLWAITEILRGNRKQGWISAKEIDLRASSRIVDHPEDHGLAIREPSLCYLMERKLTPIPAAAAR